MTCPIHVFLDTAKGAYLILEMLLLTSPQEVQLPNESTFFLYCLYTILKIKIFA